MKLTTLLPFYSVTIFAIGACYKTFAAPSNSCDPDSRYKSSKTAVYHSVWFQQAVAISQAHEKEDSLDNICTQLAQCFYLLTTCQTNQYV